MEERSNIYGDVGGPVVSVVMPVYNEEGVIRESIESILSQTFTSLELIIVDDASEDESKSIAEEYAAGDSRVRVVSHEQNQGNYPSRNEGMALSEGEFIAVMDADDIAKPQRLERQVRFLRQYREYVLVGSQVLLVDPEGEPLGLKREIPTEHEEIDAALMDRRWAVVHPSVMMRKRAVERVQGYRERFETCADHDIYLRLAEIGRIANLPDALLHYRRHYGSMTLNPTDQHRNLRIIQREARKRRGLDPLDAETPPVLEERPLSRKQKMEAHLRWAAMAMMSGYLTNSFKHIKKALQFNASGAALKVFRRIIGSIRKLAGLR